MCNPLAVWDVVLHDGEVHVLRESPALSARSSERMLSVESEDIVHEGLPTASAADLASSRVLEHRLCSAAGIDLSNATDNAPGLSPGKRCARVPVPH